MSKGNFVIMTPNMTDADKAKLKEMFSEEEAKELIDKYHQTYPELKRCKEQ